jgi:hypothetical protein
VSKFQQRHYVAIAKVIAEEKTCTEKIAPEAYGGEKFATTAALDAIEHMEDKLTKLFESDNGKFDAGRFAAACVPEGK